MSKYAQLLLELNSHSLEMKANHLKNTFFQNPNRFEQFHVKVNGFLFDFSKNNINHISLALLEQLFVEKNVGMKRNAMFAAKRINNSENRAVFHVGLRDLSQNPLVVDGVDMRPAIEQEREKMFIFSEEIRAGKITGFTGKKFNNIVNIGIGGSDLGPLFATKALSPYAQPALQSIFISNVDPAHLQDALKGLDPSETLFLVASKTFTTQETMMNAKTARAWLVAALGETAVNSHFAAISTNIAAVESFGIDKARIFGFWDWVGGRYSLMSVIGLSLAISIGRDNFMKLLQGAYEGDQHFKNAPFKQNISMLMAAITYFYRVHFGYNAHAVLPYDERLSRLPAYLQQLDMESLGKSVKADGTPVTTPTGSLIWGEAGTNGQHAFYQLLHQGTDIIPADFLVAAKGHEGGAQHEALLSNAFAQAESLMMGKENVNEPHRAFAGNRPSNFMLYEKLTPQVLGFLIALYEHKVFCLAALYDINAFDQWGVELGKEQAGKLLPLIEGKAPMEGFSSSTLGLIEALSRF